MVNSGLYFAPFKYDFTEFKKDLNKNSALGVILVLRCAMMMASRYYTYQYQSDK